MAQPPGILITRPEDQLEELSALVEQAGGRAVPFPLLKIEPVTPDASRCAAVQQGTYRIAIFVSRNAVLLGAPCLQQGEGRFPPQLTILAVGAATARELAALGADVRHPERADSEGVLAMAEAQVAPGTRILIVRGVGGREMLADTLRERGAVVDYLEVYRRIPYPWTSAELGACLSQESVRLVTVTSAESLEHFHRLLTGCDGVATPAMMLSSKRLTDLARDLGYRDLHTAEGAESARMAAAVAAWIRTV